MTCIRALAVLMCALAASLVACKTPANQGIEPVLVESVSQEPVAPRITALTPEMTRAIFAELGCPKSAITSMGCRVCPTINQSEDDAALPARQADDSVKVSLEFGQFVPGGSRQVLASYDGCGELSGGVNRVTDMIHLMQENDGVWVAQSAARLEDMIRCQTIPYRGDVVRTLCEFGSGRMSEYHWRHGVIAWSSVEQYIDPLPVASQETLITSISEVLCSENLVTDTAVKWSTVSGAEMNLETEGEVLKADVRMYIGPFDGTPDECPDGEFVFPLMHERDELTEDKVFYFLPTPNGYTERDGLSTDLDPRHVRP